MRLLLLFTIFILQTHAEDYYEILGLKKGATASEIKKAYRKLSVQYHPDKPTGNKEKYQKINKAYEVLSDEEQRRKYDMGGEEALKNPGGGGFNPFEEFFGHGFGGGFHHQHQQQRMPDVEIPLTVTLEDLYKGKTMEVLHKKRQLCHHCQGTGADDPDDTHVCPDCNGNGVKMERRKIGPGFVQQFQTTCNKCHGTGKIYGKKCHVCHGRKVEQGKTTISVVINKGMRDGDQIRFEGFGDEKPDFQTGDVIFTIRTIPHANFTRKWDDLRTTLHITLKESLLGFEKYITHLDGHKVKVAKKGITPYGSVITIKEEGMPVKHRESRGKLLVDIVVDYPSELTKEQQDVIGKYF